ncbi:fatty acid synthase-like [Polistes fuscatus]|uniref:fatty acid synthase-like n=1 Tax=Polistes fuscatus TaxID=30207 RepID=UPI001CA8F957|nr:fatty acid synthase-like [Polistes fuscatus]
MAMEVTFEAIIDAGINPVELRNKKTNVYGVLSLYESDSYLLKDKTQENGYSLLGYCRGLLSNRISFCMGLTGSNCTVHSSCTSSSLAIKKHTNYKSWRLRIRDCLLSTDGRLGRKIFLQRAENAKRVYAEVVNLSVKYTEAISRNTCLFPTAESQAQIMKQTLKHCGLKPSDVTYIEADGTGIKSMDFEELKAIDLVYGQDRSLSNPLL